MSPKKSCVSFWWTRISPAPISIVRATPIADLVYRPARSYALDLSMSTSLILVWAGFNIFRDRKYGISWRMTGRFWGFFVLKTMLPLIALFLFVFEFGGVTAARRHRQECVPAADR